MLELTPSEGPAGFTTLMPAWAVELQRLRQIASSEIPSIRLPARLACRRTKCSTSSGMSSRRLRSGGIESGITFSR